MDEPQATEPFQACSRNACKSAATATLNCNYMARRVTLEDLQFESEPDHFHLCVDHLKRFRPPLGWQIEDVRTVSGPIEIVIQPARATA
ncbi:MAG TPA: DUF3499 family protein [Actinomycetota bacterium]|nr:DUF3499 family protein [Actinomycetota bacterium]